jgi:hypothetical protein
MPPSRQPHRELEEVRPHIGAALAACLADEFLARGLPCQWRQANLGRARIFSYDALPQLPCCVVLVLRLYAGQARFEWNRFHLTHLFCGAGQPNPLQQTLRAYSANISVRIDLVTVIDSFLIERSS